MSDDRIEPYENTLTIEQLRREVRECWDFEHALQEALREAPEVAPYNVLLRISAGGRYPEDSSKGKEMQRRLGTQAVWPKHEIEIGAGLWFRIRRGLLGETEAAPQPCGQPVDD